MFIVKVPRIGFTGAGIVFLLVLVLAFATSCKTGSEKKVEKRSEEINPKIQSKTAVQRKKPINNSGSKWQEAQINAYNPFGLVNSEDCPRLPGLFFFQTEQGCETYIPGSGNKKEINRQPVFRYSVPLKLNDSGQPNFKPDPSVQASCNANVKIRVLVADLAGKRQVEVVAGSGETNIPLEIDILSDSVICRVRLF